MTLLHQHQDRDYLRSLSPAIWGRLPLAHWANGLGGMYYYDDFLDHIADTGGSAAGTLTPNGKYELYTDTGQTINHGTDVVVTDPSTLTAGSDDDKAGYDSDVDWDIGTWVFAGDGTDEDESGILSPEFCVINSLNLKRVAFECRLKLQTVANSTGAYFIGLSNEQPDNSSLTDATGEVPAGSAFLGFQILSADGNAWRPMYQAASQTKQLAGTATATAAKYIKLGFLLNPMHSPSKKLKFFVNGVEQSTYVTQTNIEAATFPDDEAMGLSFLRKMTSTTDVDVTLDYWALGMEVDRV